MSSDDSRSSKNSSLAAALIEAANPTPPREELPPVALEEIERFQDFYGLAGSALWDLFLTGHVEEEQRPCFDNIFVLTADFYAIAFCSGEFDTDSGILKVSEEEWDKNDHGILHEFFESLDSIIKDHSLPGIILQDRENMFSVEVNNPYAMLKLIEIYLDKHDVFTLDDICELTLKEKFRKTTSVAIKKKADQMRSDAAESWGIDNYSVAASEHINISYFPPMMVPTIDNADILMINAQNTEETAPFSLQLLRNTYGDGLGKKPEPHCGLTLLQ